MYIFLNLLCQTPSGLELGKPIYLSPFFFYTRSSEDFAALWASLTELRRVIVEAVIGGDWCV